MDDSKYQIDLLTALNERLMASEKMYRHVTECTGNLFLHFNYKISPVKVELLGPWDDVLKEKIINHPYDESYMLNFIAEEYQDEFRVKILDAHRHNVEKYTYEFQSKNKHHWFSADVFVTYDASGSPLEKIILFTDITKLKNTSEELEYLAYYDSLTGVYNRNYFVKKLRDICEDADNEKTSVEVLFIDIDDFKKINDSIGLLYGDELVQELGQYLNTFNCNEITVGRFGSDVFVISVYNPCGSRSADTIFRKIQERLRKPFILSNGLEVSISITAGVAEYPDAGKTSFEVMKNAEIVLYEAKDNLKAIQYFEPDILADFNKNASLEKELVSAVNNDDFVLYYQPQYFLETGKLRGVEILLRWPDKNNGGFMSEPSEFVPIAEKNLSIVPLGEWILKEAMFYYNEWRAKYHIPFMLCINISSVQLEQENFVEMLQKLIQIYEIAPGNIELELKEKLLGHNTKLISDRIKTLRGLGFNIAIDNYGADVTSLKSIKDFEIDTLKISKEFVNEAVKSDYAGIITETIVNLASKMHVKTVAEGVETKEQFDFMRKLGCDVVSGFYISKPMPKSEYEKVLIRQMP